MYRVFLYTSPSFAASDRTTNTFVVYYHELPTLDHIRTEWTYILSTAIDGRQYLDIDHLEAEYVAHV